MPQSFAIDQQRTFEGRPVIYLSSQPKMGRGTDRQERTTAGVPKWSVEVLGQFEAFGRVSSEILRINVNSEADPGRDLTPYTPVHLIDFEVGVMAKTVRDQQTGDEKIVGVQVWYRASEVRSIASGTGGGRRVEAVA